MNRNRPIYHCECCGAVIRQDAYRLPPFCCGHEMVKAGEETVRDEFARELEVEPPELNGPRVVPRHLDQESEHVSV